MKPAELTTQLKTVYGENLASVILYGSSADGDFQKGYSDHNVIIILRNLAPVEIAKSNTTIKKWAKAGNPLPLFFTTQIINEAADVFPIEFYDIKERHKVLYGSDPFINIKIDLKNLRHQCEHELRSKLLNLRPRLALFADKPRELINLIIGSSSSFFAIFGGVLQLTGIKPESSKRAIAEQLAKVADMNPSIFIEIVDVREGARIWRKEEAIEKFESYLTSIEGVVKYVDNL